MRRLMTALLVVGLLPGLSALACEFSSFEAASEHVHADRDDHGHSHPHPAGLRSHSHAASTSADLPGLGSMPESSSGDPAPRCCKPSSSAAVVGPVRDAVRAPKGLPVTVAHVEPEFGSWSQAPRYDLRALRPGWCCSPYVRSRSPLLI